MAKIACMLFLAVAIPGPARAAVSWFAPATTHVSVQDVAFTNEGAALKGTLYLPDVGHKVPAVVVFHGASEPLANTELYRHLREGLPQIGIAVLVFDRRGSGASTGSEKVSYQTLADDGIAGAEAIRQLPTIDDLRVGYWGISQGGWLATIAAAHDQRAAFAVAVSTPLTSAEFQMEFAMSNRLHILGYSQGDVDDMLVAWRKLDGYFLGLNDRAAAVEALAKIETKPWFELMYLPKGSSVSLDPTKSAWRGQMDLDPFATVQQIKIPILFILGSEDPWIPVRQTVARLQEAARTHSNLQFAVIPDTNHLMMTPSSNEQMNDADPNQIAVETPQSSAYFMLLATECVNGFEATSVWKCYAANSGRLM